MPHARKAQEEHRPPLASADGAAGRQRIVAVGVVQHPTTGHYQVWLHPSVTAGRDSSPE